MPRFRFKLEPLLRNRRRAERERQRVVAVLETERRTLEGSIRREQGAISAGKSDLGERLVGALNINAMRSQAASTIHHMRKANQLVLKLAGVHKRLGIAREALLETARARRVVELLRERRYAAWRDAIEKAEDAVLDELAVQAAARKELSP